MGTGGGSGFVEVRVEDEAAVAAARHTVIDDQLDGRHARAFEAVIDDFPKGGEGEAVLQEALLERGAGGAPMPRLSGAALVPHMVPGGA